MVHNEDFIIANKTSWDEVAPRFFGRTALPTYGPFAPDENELKLFGDISGRKVLDIGCGSGHSLAYMASRGAAELWGLDLSDTQIATARTLLEAYSAKVKQLYQSPMENNPGIPQNYFDIVYSIYAIGWSVDLAQTLRHVHAYLKPGGTFVFSWEHPFHNRIMNVDGHFVIARSYHEEGLYQSEAWHDRHAIMNQIKLSTYINLLVETGFRITQVVEDAVVPEDAERGNLSRWYPAEKAELIPAAFIVKCMKS